nr:tape measure protein [uncultured Chryseobacterium sp.]
MTQGALHFDALLSVNNFDQGIARIKSGIREASGVAVKEAQVMDSAFKNLGTAIGGYFTAQSLFSFTKELINVRGEFQKTEIAFSTMLGSASQAKTLMGQMVTLAEKTPFSLNDVSSGAKQLLAFQVPANQVVETLTRLGNIASGLGVPLERINLIYGQVKAKNKLMGQELLQFTEAGIPMIAELAKKFGKTESEITDMVSAGKVGFKDVQDVLFAMTNEGGMFFQLMEKQSASLSGKVANLGDAWDQMLNKIGASSEGVLYGAIEGATYLVDNYQEVAQTLLELIAAYGLYKAAVIATSVISASYNKTILSEIALLGISEKMKLGRAMVTQRQAEATARDAAAELASTRAKYSALQVEVSSLAVKKQSAIQSGINASAKAQEARVQLQLARMELTAIQATGSARQIELAQKRVESAQNNVIATQETAAIARKRALAAATEFNTAKQQLENTAQAVGTAEKTAAIATETAQVAAKNANSIATTRLTFLQNLQTLATQAGTKAQAFLNATILANPYATAAVLLAALTYAIYKHANALTALQEIQKKFKEELSQTNTGVNEQVSKINALISTIKQQSTSYEQAKKLLEQINKLTNSRIEGLTVEAIRTGQADAAIKKYTETLYKQAEAMLKVQEIAKLEEELKKLNEDLSTVTFGEKFNATFNIFDDNYYRKGWQGAKEERKKAIQQTISDYKKDVEKAIKDGLDLSSGTIEVEPPKVKLGILEGLNEELKAANERIEKATSDGEIKKWISIRDKIQSKIDSYGVKKKKPKEEKQLAEIFPFGTPKQIQQQIQLLDDAMTLVEKGMVKIRKLNKYGNDKDKKGNPYLTGEIISLEEAGRRRDQLEEKYNSLAYKNFQERTNEAERQWNNYYQMVEFYGKKSADSQYKNLFGGVQSYMEFLGKQLVELESKRDKGILTEQEKKDIIFIQEKMRDLSGVETPLENFKRSVQESLKSMPSLVDQMDYINTAIEKNRMSSQSNSPEFFGKNKFLEEQKRNVLQQQKDTYDAFIQEQQKFEDKKIAIQNKYEDFRKRIGEDQSINDKDRLTLLDKTYKNEAKEIANASLENLQKNELWIRAFEDLGKVGPKTLQRLKKSLREIIETNKNLSATDLKVIQDQIIKIDDVITSRDPFASITIAIQKYRDEKKKLADAEKKFGKNSKEYDEQLDSTRSALTNIFTSAQDAANGVIEFTSQLAGALGLLSEESQEALKNAQQLFDGIINAVTGYLSQNYAKMIGGIVQMITSITKAMNGDIDRENTIRQWGREIEKLKSLYEQLNKEIEKTAGESQLKMQRDLISNLKQQQEYLVKMRRTENEKKGSDSDKIASYTQQIEDINNRISEITDNFKNTITTSDFKDLSQKIAEALSTAFAQGEDAARSFDKVVDDVMKNAVQNALRIKILEPVAKDMVDQIYQSMGFGQGDTSILEKDLITAQDKLKSLNDLINNSSPLNYEAIQARFEIEKVEKLISSLKQQIANSDIAGSFDGLTKEERDNIKSMGEDAMKKYMEALKQYQDLFGQSAENAQGLKGDIKGITEKTAGALEGQINAMRINVAEGLKIHKANQAIFTNQLQVQSQIEKNTRPIEAMYKEIKELNSKIKNQLAGI